MERRGGYAENVETFLCLSVGPKRCSVAVVCPTPTQKDTWGADAALVIYSGGPGLGASRFMGWLWSHLLAVSTIWRKAIDKSLSHNVLSYPLFPSTSFSVPVLVSPAPGPFSVPAPLSWEGVVSCQQSYL